MTRIATYRLFISMAICSVLFAVPVSADPPSQVGRLNLINGSVSFLPGSLNEWVPASLNYPLSAGDHLWTDAGSGGEVHVRNAAIRLNENTEFGFLTLDDQTVQARISGGSINVYLRNVDNETAFEIDTPNAVVFLLNAGSYRIDVQQNGETNITVRSGQAEVTAGRALFEVYSGQSTVVSGYDTVSYYITNAFQSDDWDAWCASRDRREDRVASTTQVSHEMIGIEDLDENGTWYVMADYGPVWAPSRVPAGWAPYRFGHWAWVNPWGWTWIDDTSWGFAPFHYGRWAFLNAGWVWIPGDVAARPVYAPALVVFVGGGGWNPASGDGIGWFPLGPRELYIPPYQASPVYVQKMNVAVSVTVNVQIIQSYNPAKVVYVNRGAPQAVTFVPRTVFVQSRPAAVAALQVTPIEVSRAPVMGMTARVAPERESVIARPVAPKAPAPQPPVAMQMRRVLSRTVPAAAQIPFAQQQKALVADPGKPIASQAAAGAKPVQEKAPLVTIVNPSTLTRIQTPPVVSKDQPAPTRMQTPPMVSKDQPESPAGPAPQVQQKPAPGAPVAGRQAATPKTVDKQSTDAAALIATLKNRTIPDAEKRISEARGVAGIRIDLNAVARAIAVAKGTLAGAEKDLAAGKSEIALQKAAAAQRQIEEQMNKLTAAIQAARQGQQQGSEQKPRGK